MIYGIFYKKNGQILIKIYTTILLIVCHVELLQLLLIKATLQNIKYFYNKYLKFTEIKFPS